MTASVDEVLGMVGRQLAAAEERRRKGSEAGTEVEGIVACSDHPYGMMVTVLKVKGKELSLSSPRVMQLKAEGTIYVVEGDWSLVGLECRVESVVQREGRWVAGVVALGAVEDKGERLDAMLRAQLFLGSKEVRIVSPEEAKERQADWREGK